MISKTTARIATEVFTANIHHATPISRTMENTQSRERRATANAAKEWEWSKNIRGRKEQMDKKEILDILDNAKDERGAVPMRLVRQAFDKLPTIQPEKAQLSQEGTTKGTISRQAALEKVRTMQTYKLFMGDDMILVDKAEIQTELMMLPTIQPETAKRIVGKSRDGMTLWYQCDMCNEPVDEQDDYCRGCGRRLIDG